MHPFIFTMHPFLSYFSLLCIHWHMLYIYFTLLCIHLADSEDGMLVLQALVEGTVLEAHPTMSSENKDVPIIELYIPSQYGSEVINFHDLLLIIILYYRVKHSLIENLLIKVLLSGEKIYPHLLHLLPCRLNYLYHLCH